MFSFCGSMLHGTSREWYGYRVWASNIWVQIPASLSQLDDVGQTISPTLQFSLPLNLEQYLSVTHQVTVKVSQ